MTAAVLVTLCLTAAASSIVLVLTWLLRLAREAHPLSGRNRLTFMAQPALLLVVALVLVIVSSAGLGQTFGGSLISHGRQLGSRPAASTCDRGSIWMSNASGSSPHDD